MTSESPNESRRYSTVAILLHWLIAISVIAMIPMGWWMANAINDPSRQQLAYQVYQLHKSVGFLILILTVARLGWRLGHPVPSLPAAMPAWERFSARAAHAAFYVLLLLLPLTGWAYVSSGWAVGEDHALNVATSWFGLFQIPHWSFIAEMGEAARRSTAFGSMNAHAFLSWGTVALTGLHIGAALNHHYRIKDSILAGITPWLKMGEPGPTASDPGARPLVVGALVIGLTAFAGWIYGLSITGPTVPSPVEPKASVTASTEQPIIPGSATAWTIDRPASSISFSAAHAGNPFVGRFEEWEGHIWFDPANLAGSKAVILIKTGSARTGDSTQEGSLTEQEWFDPASFPTARFETTAFTRLGGDRYEAKGTLRVKDRTVPVSLRFTLRITGGRAHAEGRLGLDREALNMGLRSDPTGQWVTRQIEVNIIVAARTELAPAP